MSQDQVEINSNSSNCDIYDLLSSYTYRPIIDNNFNYERNSVKAIRIASWNLHNFDQEKARNLGVIEVICLTILENKWSIVAIQDISDEMSLKIICDELNRPSIKYVKQWQKNSKSWKFYYMCNTSNQLGYIYDSLKDGIGIEIEFVSQKTIESCSSAIVSFTIENVQFAIINLNSISSPEQFENSLRDVIEDFSGPLLIVGDFSKISEDEKRKMKKSVAGLEIILPLSINTCCHYLKSNSRFNDSILINDICRIAHFTGYWGVVREGLVHLAIPEGWDWGGAVSTHCPIWGEFYVMPNEAMMRTRMLLKS